MTTTRQWTDGTIRRPVAEYLDSSEFRKLFRHNARTIMYTWKHAVILAMRLKMNWFAPNENLEFITTEKEKRILAMRPKILAFLESKAIPLTRKQIAKGLGYQNQSGVIGTVMASMVESGELVDDDGELSVRIE